MATKKVQTRALKNYGKEAQVKNMPYPNPLLNYTNTQRASHMPFNPFYVVSPDPTDPNSWSQWNWNGGDQPVTVTFMFSLPVDPSSFIIGENFIFRARGDVNAKGSIAPVELYYNGSIHIDFTTYIFTTEKTGEELLAPQPDAAFFVHLYGADLNPTRFSPFSRKGIKDIYGTHLDGAYTGSFAGSTYTGFFGLIG